MGIDIYIEKLRGERRNQAESVLQTALEPRYLVFFVLDSLYQ